MAIQVLRPNGTTSNDFTVTGAANAHSATNDNSDSSYLSKTTWGSSVLQFGTYTIPGGQYVRGVRVRVRYETLYNSGTDSVLLRAWAAAGSTLPLSGFYLSTYPAGKIEYVGAWQPTRLDGSSWSQANIDGLEVAINFGQYAPRYYPKIYEVYVDLDVTSPPSIDIPAPASPVTTTSRPTATFTYSDSDSDPMLGYELRVFTAAQYGAGGFDPATSEAVWETGFTISSLTLKSVTIREDLLDGVTYRIYGRVAQYDADLTTYTGFSAWAYKQFTMNISALDPTVPTITVSSDEFEQCVNINLSNADAFNTYALVERSDDFGVTWVPVRAANYALVPTGVSQFYQDFEAPPNVDLLYRARLYYFPSGVVMAGGWSASAEVMLESTGWHLKDPLNSALNYVEMDVLGSSMTQSSAEDKAIFSPLGRPRKVAVYDVIKGQELTLTVDFLDEDNFIKFQALRNAQHTLLLVRGWTNEQWYITFDQVEEMELFNYSPTYRQVRINCIEVDPPTIPGFYDLFPTLGLT